VSSVSVPPHLPHYVHRSPAAWLLLTAAAQGLSPQAGCSQLGRTRLG
jgi:hypothetical protein